jgi:hypothetical protein
MQAKVFSTSDGAPVPLLLSATIPASFRHGFTTRAGGVSGKPFDSLNLGWKWGDRPENVEENHRRLRGVSGATRMFRVSQVHGNRIVQVGRTDHPDDLATEQGDGLCTDEPGACLSIHVADCTPILLACPRTGACAALHAGWRGTTAGIVRTGVETMVERFGCRPEDLRAALGPCIGACCFEVGPEVVEVFLSARPSGREEGWVIRGPRQEHVDLRRVQELDLIAAGVSAANIDVGRDCTRCDPDQRFFSLRKAGQPTGQMVGFIVRS